MQWLALASFVATAAAQAWTEFPVAVGDADSLSEPMYVEGSFDCEWYRYGRGASCDNDEDGGEDLAVFILADGATLNNCIIGADQYEGIHCEGACTLNFVWWEDVCEDALTLEGSGTSYVVGGGAVGASDKVIQHNGIGAVEIWNFYIEDYGKLYRSCGNCKQNGGPRTALIDGAGAYGSDKGPLAGINTNYGDSVTIRNSCGIATAKMCERYTGCDKAEGDCDAEKLGAGFDGESCIDGGGNSASC